MTGGRPLAQRVAFSSEALAHLDDRARRDRFHETFESLICGADISFPADQPFFMQHRFARVADIRIGQTAGTISRITRDAGAIARSPDNDVFVMVNRGVLRIGVEQAGQQTVLPQGHPVLLAHGAALDFRTEGCGDWIGIVVPRERLSMAVPDVDGIVGRPLLERKALGGLLASYAEGLLNLDAASYDDALARHVETTLVDLITLMLGGTRDAAEMARLRGLRAARLQEILAVIRARFTEPDFSTDILAESLGVSARYVNKLLFETGQTFAERLLELRLQKAKSMLVDTRFDRMKVSDIAFACGFNDVSHFNRKFRLRFGCSPTQVRGGSGKAE